jgi:hypothetical protein
MILYCASDLIWATRIRSTAEALGIPSRPARNLEMLQARLEDSPVRGMIVDLETGETALSLITAVRGWMATEKGRPVSIVAFGPHVNVEMLEAARAAGADQVFVRGAFDRALPQLLNQMSGRQPDSDNPEPS